MIIEKVKGHRVFRHARIARDTETDDVLDLRQGAASRLGPHRMA